jgi:hypothetical protein
MKEYGTNIQKLADCIMAVYDREQRTKQAHVLIELMRQIHPNMREGQDYSKKLWDDLYIITDFELDVDSPFPPPPKEILGRKPLKVPYMQRDVRFRFYGRNIELLVLKAIATSDIGERRAFVSYLIKQMKAFYQAWNKETVAMDDIYQHISILSEQRLDMDVEYIKREGLIDSNPKDGNSRFQRQPSNNERTNNFRSNNNNRSASSSNTGSANNRNQNNNPNNNNRNFRNNNTGGNNNPNNNNRKTR